MSVGASSRNASGRHRTGDRAIEVLAVVLLGIATVGTAWCGYQSTRWNGEETDRARTATAAHLEAGRLFGLATQLVSYDSNLVVAYAEATSAENVRLQEFLRESLIRPEFLPLLDEWEAAVLAGDALPGNLLQNEEYLDEQFADYRLAEAAAGDLELASAEAGENADSFVLTTLLLASALFFAGVTTSFRVRLARVALLAGAVITVAYAAARLADLPVA